MKDISKQMLEDIYTAAFNKELAARAGEGYIVTDDNGHEIGHDTGVGKFYLCGFTGLHYYCNTPAGRTTHKIIKLLGFKPSKNYYGGFNFYLDSARQHSNGMYEIMNAGYQAVARFLNEQGLDVGIDTRLD